MASLGEMVALPVEATSTEPTKFFNFFGLPRELRDMIYNQPGLFAENLYCRGSAYGPKMTVRKPSTSMLLVNRQFSREYNQSAQDEVTLLAKYCDEWYY